MIITYSDLVTLRACRSAKELFKKHFGRKVYLDRDLCRKYACIFYDYIPWMVNNLLNYNTRQDFYKRAFIINTYFHRILSYNRRNLRSIEREHKQELMEVWYHCYFTCQRQLGRTT